MKTIQLTFAAIILLASACSPTLNSNLEQNSIAAGAKRVRTQATAENVSIASSSVSKSPLVVGGLQTAKVVLASTSGMSNLLVDIRIYNSDTNTMIVRKGFENVSISSGSALSLQYDYQSDSSLALGNYDVRVGIWSADWSKTYLYETRDKFSVVASTVTPPPPPPPVTSAISIASSTVAKNSLTAGDAQTIKVALTSGSSYSGLLVDIRIYNSATNTMIIRKGFENINVAANSSTSLQFDYLSATDLTAGVYEIRVGVWSSDWSKTYLYETRNSFSVVSSTVTPPPPPPPPPPDPSTITYLAPVIFNQGQFSISSAIAKSSLTAGQIQYAKMRITSSAAATGLVVSMRYLDANGAQLMERSLPSGNFYAGETKEIILDYAFRVDDPAGTYSIGIGIWSANYGSLYLYQRNLPNFTVNSSGYVPPIPTTLLPNTNFAMISGVDAFVYNGSYFVQNNMWGITGLPSGYSQQAGIGAITATGGVQARWKYNFPTDGPNEVKAYPAVGFGQKPGQTSTPNSGLPRQISAINSAISSWDVQSMYTGRGHLSYDLWLTRDGNRYPCFPCTPITHEIMLAVDNYNDYATSNPGWYFSSTVIDGVTYRVWKADNFGGGGIQWRFIVLQMVNPIHVQKGSVDFKKVFNYLQSVGLITGQEYLASIEFGNEMVYGTGDVFVKDFKAEIK